jgi:hypothetical protein
MSPSCSVGSSENQTADFAFSTLGAERVLKIAPRPANPQHPVLTGIVSFPQVNPRKQLSMVNGVQLRKNRRIQLVMRRSRVRVPIPAPLFPQVRGLVPLTFLLKGAEKGAEKASGVHEKA